MLSPIILKVTQKDDLNLYRSRNVTLHQYFKGLSNGYWGVFFWE